MKGKTMKLSDCMREGAKRSGQAFGALQTVDGRTCAMGAAMLGGGMIINEQFGPWVPAIYELWSQFPWLRTVLADCPECGPGWRETVYGIAIHVNDNHHWTRERIADWLDTVDPTILEPVVESETEELIYA